MKVQEYANSDPQTFSLLTSSLDTVDVQLIEEIVPLPLTAARQWSLTAARQWYVFKCIRQLCTDMQKADKVAPKSYVPEPKEVEEDFKKEE